MITSHTYKTLLLFAAASAVALLSIPRSFASAITPERMTCEYMENPGTVDATSPRLSWINAVQDGVYGERQTAYEIQAATRPELLLEGKADLWKTGKVKSDNSIHVKYAGKPLESGMDCWWRVRVWDSKGKASQWSEPAKWHMGLLSPDDWKAVWIGVPWQGDKPVGVHSNEMPHPSPLLRKRFRVEKEIESAYIYTTGLGYFELYCNGRKVGDDVLAPNQTLWGKRENLHEYGIPVQDNFTEYRVMYLCHDLTSELKKGENAIGAMLGNGFYNSPSHWILSYGSPRFIAQLEIKYTDGSSETIVSDESWRAAPGPIVFDRIYDGEHYDARLEYPGWCSAGLDDGNWRNAVRRNAPEGRMKAQTYHSDKVMERLSPVKIEKLEGPGNYRIDFGEEISGWVRLSGINGPRGRRIDIKYLSESPNGANSYTLSGEGDESYAARFTWFVFRTVEVSGWPGELNKDRIVAEAVYTETETAAHFECSNELFNTINKIWRRSQTDNMHGGIASDCPHRERSAYTGDGQVVISTVTHNYDAAAFYKKWIEDIVGAQDKTTGYVPNGAPWQPGCGGGVAWGAAIAVMPWEYYMTYADRDILAYSYEGMKGYVEYMKQWVDRDGIMFHQAPDRDNPNMWMNLGDWCPPYEYPPTDMVHTFYYWMCASNTANTAGVLGYENEAEAYRKIAEDTREAFIGRFYDEDNGTFGKYGGNIFALRMGMPEGIRIRVVEALRRDIAEAEGHLDTGIFGTRYFFEMLCDNGLNDFAYEAMNKTTYPGFGHWIAQGATTTWERWNGADSRNHPMFGGGLTWFYRKLAGMMYDEPGYRKIIFKPNPAAGMTCAEYSKDTPYGKAGIRWDRSGDRIEIEVTVPVGCEADVYVPMRGGDTGAAGNTVNKFVKYMGSEDGYARYKVSSGKYVFKGTA